MPALILLLCQTKICPSEFSAILFAVAKPPLFPADNFTILIRAEDGTRFAWMEDEDPPAIVDQPSRKYELVGITRGNEGLAGIVGGQTGNS
ncbi:MAG: hypothetical protein EBV19_06610 [Flavobacteriia bacterium]|nr:hypothetical protein [Flavobacteriia bacterium]